MNAGLPDVDAHLKVLSQITEALTTVRDQRA